MWNVMEVISGAVPKILLENVCNTGNEGDNSPSEGQEIIEKLNGEQNSGKEKKALTTENGNHGKVSRKSVGIKKNSTTNGNNDRNTSVEPSSKVASEHCHICTRLRARDLPVARCAGVYDGLCRKVVCKRCFEANGWDWNRAMELVNEKTYRCVHCTQFCPPGSQCHVYKKSNEKRKKYSAALASSSQKKS
uniref:Zinc-finger domain-containing protein n=1 Tax=Timspurckia oligopyrenoides TaxID=708627 RepID=A0A7S0ZGW1_9RHOD|mmetsp:Transcript_4704/g.8204  ORF Transcript_4704/g.8204 Transcript_4704/m.8204 type:complete len:191 (+) Transcript_4704:136-708(+)